ncbi:arginine deiminase [Mycoplasmatota bacterium]|nr:arginine deiminase [Mycoplasmatota bacterium]
MKHINVNSEIGRLKKVLLHRPGKELENLKPEWLERLLFDDIPWLELAQKEHDEFADVFRQNKVEVVYLEDLVSETLDQSNELKSQFISQFLDESHVVSETLRHVVTEYLNSFDNTKEMIEKTMSGIRKKEIPNWTKRTLSDYIGDYPFVCDPMPNLYFTRDPFSSVGNGITMSKMYTLTRRRETIFGDYIFKYHNVYGKNNVERYYDRDQPFSIEGGDILVLSDKILAVGVSQRTHPLAIESLVKNILYKYNTSFEMVLAFDIPKTRAFMHLDTVFTRVDHDKFTIHSQIDDNFKVYELTKDTLRPGKLSVKPIVERLDIILSRYLNENVTLIPCGGGDEVISGREQWNDGANTLALSPGEVIVYGRNYVTNAILKEHGVKVHAISSSELSRGRGGPRCMSMPLLREDV